MRFDLLKEIRKTFRLGSDDFKATIKLIGVVLVVVLVLGSILNLWDFIASKQTDYKYKICEKGLFRNCEKADKYRINNSGSCVKYWNEKENLLCGDFIVKELK